MLLFTLDNKNILSLEMGTAPFCDDKIILYQTAYNLFLFKAFLATWVFFVGSLIPLFWNSGDVSSGFQSQFIQNYLIVYCHFDIMKEIHLNVLLQSVNGP